MNTENIGTEGLYSHVVNTLDDVGVPTGRSKEETRHKCKTTLVRFHTRGTTGNESGTEA